MAKKEDLMTAEELLPLLELEAKSKGLTVFHFSNKELQEFFTVKGDDIDVLVVSKTLDTARFNLKNMRHSYLVKNKYDVCEIMED